MQIQTEDDFPKLRLQITEWRKKFPMFYHNVNEIEHIIENHIQNYSICLVNYRQTKKKNFLEKAQKEIDSINRVIETVEKMELVALLAR